MLCGVCGKELNEKKGQKKTCSWKCRAIYVNSLNRGRPSKFKGIQTGRIPKTAFKKGIIPWNKDKKGLMPIPWNKGKKTGVVPWNKGLKGCGAGIKRSEETKKKMSLVRLGKHPSAETRKKMSLSRKGVKLSQATRRKMSATHKRLKSWERLPHKKGSEHYYWKGGISPEHNKIRQSIEYRIWSNAIFSRDNWTCQKTGIRGGKLAAHHIKNFAQYPELRFAIDNGITLEKDVHKYFHKKYGKKNNTQEQLIEFLTNNKITK